MLLILCVAAKRHYVVRVYMRIVLFIECVCLCVWFWRVQGERKIPVLIGISVGFALHVVGVYWWYQNDDLMYPLIMLPPKEIPPFWHAIFIIMVNGVFLVLSSTIACCMV